MNPRSGATALFLELADHSPRAPGLKELGRLGEAFARLPWENLTKYLAKHGLAGDIPGGPRPHAAPLPPALRDVPGAAKLRLGPEVLADHAAFGTGGTCFSLTNALRDILADLGYRCHPAMADMSHGPNSHCGLIVKLDESTVLMDPGYLVAEPVVLRPGRTTRVELPGQRLEYRPVDGSDEVVLHTVNQRGQDLCRYRLRPAPVPENEFVGHWLASFDAPGMNGLHLNRLDGGTRLSAHDLNLRLDTGAAKRNLKLRDDYARQVATRFGLDAERVRRAHAHWQEARCRNR